MPGQYPTSEGLRPRLCDDGKQADATARLYLCARCFVQVLICPCCDRGNIYCEQGGGGKIIRTPHGEAYRRGYFAGRRGCTSSGNPYESDSREARAWNRGLNEGRQRRLTVVRTS